MKVQQILIIYSCGHHNKTWMQIEDCSKQWLQNLCDDLEKKSSTFWNPTAISTNGVTVRFSTACIRPIYQLLNSAKLNAWILKSLAIWSLISHIQVSIRQWKLQTKSAVKLIKCCYYFQRRLETLSRMKSTKKTMRCTFLQDYPCQLHKSWIERHQYRIDSSNIVK